jgi:hypothetical protein
MGRSRFTILNNYEHYGSILMTKARDLANLASDATSIATDAEVAAAVAAADSTPTALMTMGA